jgi:hypothetical protein
VITFFGLSAGSFFDSEDSRGFVNPVGTLERESGTLTREFRTLTHSANRPSRSTRRYSDDRVPEPSVQVIRPAAINSSRAAIQRPRDMPHISARRRRPGLTRLLWGRRPKRAEKHAKEPDFSRISRASLWLGQRYREAGDFAACNYCG